MVEVLKIPRNQVLKLRKRFCFVCFCHKMSQCCSSRHSGRKCWCKTEENGIRVAFFFVRETFFLFLLVFVCLFVFFWWKRWKPKLPTNEQTIKEVTRFFLFFMYSAKMLSGRGPRAVFVFCFFCFFFHLHVPSFRFSASLIGCWIHFMVFVVVVVERAGRKEMKGKDKKWKKTSPPQKKTNKQKKRAARRGRGTNPLAR